MKSYKITGIDLVHLCDSSPRFFGFRLENEIGSVCPFVDGEFMPPELMGYLDGNGDVVKDGFIDAEMEWAKKQVGKYLQCEGLIYRAFATSGDVSISEEKPE